MELLEIEPNCLYAIRYPDQEFDEYNRIFEDHSNFENVLDFFETYKWEIGNYYVKELGITPDETEAFAQYVVEEAVELEEYFEEMIDNSAIGASPNLKGHFTILEGFENEDTPALKSYGLKRPSLLRVYAIEVDDSCLIIFYSGIKIKLSISECPVLRENVLQKARQVIEFLKQEGATDLDGVKSLAK